MRIRQFIAVSLLCFFTVAVASAAEPGADRLSEPWWRERFAEKQQALRHGPVRLLLFGDSILHSLEWQAHDPVWTHWYGNRDAVDLGFNGDRTINLIWRVQHGELDGINPKAAVILIGANDSWESADTLTRQITQLVQDIHARVPATRILLLSILPSGKPQRDQEVARSVNHNLARIYGAPDAPARFLDVSCVFLRDGKLNAALFREHDVPGVSSPLHPTPEGMDLLAARIEPEVAQALGEQPHQPSHPLPRTDCPAG